MKSILMVSIVLSTMFGLAVVAEGSPFPEGYKPEENVPGWVTSFPYQRNVLLDFSVDPQCDPGSGIPGADYEGYDDPTLMGTDFASFDPWDGTGNGVDDWEDSLQYYEVAPDGSGRTGLVGVPVNEGFPFQVPSGILNIHLDNWERPYEKKHVWITLVAKGMSSDWGWCGFPHLEASTEGPPFFESYGDGLVEDLGDGWFKRSYWGVIKPNPSWEEFQFSFKSDSVNPVLLDSIHVATECVPEPGTILMILGGLAGITGIVRRRK